MTTAAAIRVSSVEHGKKDSRLYAEMSIPKDTMQGL